MARRARNRDRSGPPYRMRADRPPVLSVLARTRTLRGQRTRSPEAVEGARRARVAHGRRSLAPARLAVDPLDAALSARAHARLRRHLARLSAHARARGGRRREGRLGLALSVHQGARLVDVPSRAAPWR